MEEVAGSAFWMRLVRCARVSSHAYLFYADGKPATARHGRPGYNPIRIRSPVFPRELSEKHTIVSKSRRHESRYWHYAAPAWIEVPAPLMFGRTAKV